VQVCFQGQNLYQIHLIQIYSVARNIEPYFVSRNAVDIMMSDFLMIEGLEFVKPIDEDEGYDHISTVGDLLGNEMLHQFAHVDIQNERE